MDIAILGTRGIPANYSGLEECVEQTATRLVERGHSVTVYCRARLDLEQPATYRGVTLVWLPVLATKHGETILHTLLSCIHLLLRWNRRTVVHLYGVGNAPFLVLFTALGFPCLISVDGQDWRRAKWGRIASAYLLMCARIAARLARFCIVDSQVVEEFYKQHFGTPNIRYIPYGYTSEPEGNGGIVLDRLGLRSRNYVLFVGRVVPEKGVHYLLEAYARVDTDKKLVVVGATQDEAYHATLKQMATPNTILAGPIYGDDSATLYRNAYMYVHPSDVDGTSHALLSAMGNGLTPLVSDIPENLETIGGCGFSFKRGNPEDLASQLRRLVAQPQLLAQVGMAAQRRIRTHYNWDLVTDQLESLYQAARS